MPLHLTADALADVLEDAGICSPHCQALTALAGDDGVNQAIAIGARFCPEIQIVAREKSHVATANLAVWRRAGRQLFETSPPTRRRPAQSGSPAAEEWLTAELGTLCPPLIRLPRAWDTVGYGRFGHAISECSIAKGLPEGAGLGIDCGRTGPCRTTTRRRG